MGLALRRFLTCLLDDFSRLDDVVIAACEMFDNSIQHTRSKLPGGEVTVEVRRWPGCCVTLSVTDQGGPGEPRVRQLTADRLLDEHGRGLSMLDTVTSCWGWHGDVRGRSVTAIILG